MRNLYFCGVGPRHAMGAGLLQSNFIRTKMGCQRVLSPFLRDRLDFGQEIVHRHARSSEVEI